MQEFRICYNDTDAMPALLEKRAQELNLTTEQLIRILIDEGIRGDRRPRGLKEFFEMGNTDSTGNKSLKELFDELGANG